MHELALADAVARTAVRVGHDEGIGTVERVVVGIGRLQQIEKELFEFSLATVAVRYPALADAEFELVDEPVAFECRACGTGFPMPEPESADVTEAMHLIPELAHAYVRCPACGGADFEITSGRGVTLLRLVGTAEDDDG